MALYALSGRKLTKSSFDAQSVKRSMSHEFPAIPEFPLSSRVERSGIEGSWHPVTLCVSARGKILRLAQLAQDDTPKTDMNFLTGWITQR